MASRGSRGQTVASAREGHLSGAGSRELGVGELSCTNGFGNEERSGSCARSTGGQRRALTRPRRGLKRIPGAFLYTDGFIYTWRGRDGEG